MWGTFLGSFFKGDSLLYLGGKKGCPYYRKPPPPPPCGLGSRTPELSGQDLPQHDFGHVLLLDLRRGERLTAVKTEQDEE